MNETSTSLPQRAARPLTRRALAKQKTRLRLLGAARQLFNERGYAAATVRDIAAAAGLSTGAVFACFADKADLFGEVILSDYDLLIAHLEAADDKDAPAQVALMKLFSAAYSVHKEHLSLVRAAIGFSWLSEPEDERRVREGAQRVLVKLGEVLERAVGRGELSPGLDVRLTSEMIWDSFVANYRRAIFDGWSGCALEARLASQIEVLLVGWRAAA